ncbi:MAG: dihydroneopterin aldolase [Alphaproteobacteria bacterium]
MPPPSNQVPQVIADAKAGIRHVFVHDLVLDCRIGVHKHEHGKSQRVRINLDLAVLEGAMESQGDALSEVLCYEEIVKGTRKVVDAGHVNLVETLAERIAEVCLADPRVRLARVRVEKLDAFDDIGAVGIEIERRNRFA